jgi:hypothetical protein
MMWMGAVCLVAGSAAVAQAVPQPPTVKIAQGELAGKFIADARQKAFLGLPYAAPPVGELRWKAPQPAAGWKRVRDATKFGNRCEQWHIWNDYGLPVPQRVYAGLGEAICEAAGDALDSWRRVRCRGRIGAALHEFGAG